MNELIATVELRNGKSSVIGFQSTVPEMKVPERKVSERHGRIYSINF